MQKKRVQVNILFEQARDLGTILVVIVSDTKWEWAAASWWHQCSALWSEKWSSLHCGTGFGHSRLGLQTLRRKTLLPFLETDDKRGCLVGHVWIFHGTSHRLGQRYCLGQFRKAQWVSMTRKRRWTVRSSPSLVGFERCNNQTVERTERNVYVNPENP